MRLSLKRVHILTAVAWVGGALVASAAAPSDLVQLDFFEKKIRPVLAQECYECHSATAKKLKGGLLLDTADGLLTGGDSGPAIVPGKPDKSLLLSTMKHSDADADLHMPPKKDILPDQVLADFEQWIKMGAPDPRDGKATRKLAWDDTTAKSHWAFQPIKNPAVPTPADAKKFITNPIDAFVLAKLTEKKLAPSAKADKATLLRRVTYDLTGLPPTPAEMDAFLADNSPGAYEKTIDRLLASPAYGERWARHWLDIARYSDTNGDRLNGKRQPLFPYAWTYRDYVINAFNADLPYDQFIVEQIAADRLPDAQKDKSKLAGLGFLTVGKRFMGNENDVLDDRIDVVTKGLMGLTASCARCHDHKFDPIPTKDYYSLHGVFNSSTEPDEQPVIAEFDKESADYKAYQEEMAKVDKEIDEYRRTNAARLVSGMLVKSGDYLLAVHDAGSSMDSSKKGDNFRLMARQRGLEAEVAFIWMDRIKAAKKSDPVIGPWMKFAELPADQFAERGPVLAKEIAAAGDAQPALAAALEAKAPTTLKDVAAVYTEIFAELRKQLDLPTYLGYKGAGRNNKFPLAKVEAKLDGPMETLRQCMFGGESPVLPDEKLMSRALGVQFTNPETAIRAKSVSVDFAHPGAPVRAMTLVDKPNPKDSPVFIRGEATNRGPIAPRKFLTVLSYGKDEPFKDGSGRLELARRIASRDNPLTARVLVNRTWQWHFGQAIVRTVSDFGTRSEPPTHPEMLDWMATWFMDNGWSVKKLHKLILLSSTYQQDSVPNERGMAEDPTNQWLWRANVQRLDFEQIRDTMLTVGGKLERDLNGRPFAMASSAAGNRYKGMVADALQPKTSPDRRTVYAMIDRNALPDMFGTFDFANPDMSTGERMLTTVPQQALFMLNSPFVVEQVKNLLTREDFPKDALDEEKVRFIFRTTLQRQPTPKELELARDFLSNDPPEPLPDPALAPQPGDDKKTALRKAIALKANQPAKQLNVWERYAQTVIQTNELIYLR
ncbi:MAG: PSD1 and planctomycete cytochrome C domain-containing protein [Chthoniobacteraceae bacterium]